MYNVYQHWDPLRTCVVGRGYPPEFYSWIQVPHVRDLFEKMAQETEEDYQAIVKKLESFGVKVFRPELPSTTMIGGKHMPPPMTPRDEHIMLGTTFYENWSFNFGDAYKNAKNTAWPECGSYEEFLSLPLHIQDECNERYQLSEWYHYKNGYAHIYKHIEEQGNLIKHHAHFSHGAFRCPGAMISRIGQDLFFGTPEYPTTTVKFPYNYQQIIDEECPDTRNHIVYTGGHSDGTYCPVAPGLIISLKDVPTYAETFPGWEVVYLPEQSWGAIQPFLHLKNKNRGKWWIPGFEYDSDVIDCVETWLNHWTGYVEETVFDVNMLIIDPKNVMVFNYNKQVFDALDRHGITPHIVPFRHRYFWDGGIHCVTMDLHREGVRQDFFPGRL